MSWQRHRFVVADLAALIAKVQEQSFGAYGTRRVTAELPVEVSRVAAIREFFRSWAEELDSIP